MSPPHASSFAQRSVAALVVLAVLWLAPGAHAQNEDVSDVFSGFGTAEVADEEEPAVEEGTGVVAGQLLDQNSGLPVAGATVILMWPPTEDGSPPRQEVATTGGGGDFEFASVPAGLYDVQFIKSGYRPAKMQRLEVVEGQVARADFPMPPVATESSGEVLDLAEFVAEASVVGEMFDAVEIRMESDELLNIMGAEDFSKFSAGDVAEALKRVAGVNIVEGQFAVIRGLDDRYSSTLYNSAPVPSPDPDRQSVQLDLFVSDIVQNLVVAKTFGPAMPGNSSAGNIDIVTLQYPEEFEAKISMGAGFNQYALKRFLELQPLSPVGNEIPGGDTVESEFGGSFGGTTTVWGRELRLRALANNEIDYETALGHQESRLPDQAIEQGRRPPFTVVQNAGLADGTLTRSKARFDLTESTRTEQATFYGGLGWDWDEAGDHKFDFSAYYTTVDDDTVELRENGYFPRFDYSALFNKDFVNEADFTVTQRVAARSSWLVSKIRPEGTTGNRTNDGTSWFASYGETRSFEEERDLQLYQLNGDHRLFAPLRLTWAANYAETGQNEVGLGVRYTYEACGFEDSGYNVCPAGVARIPIPAAFPVTVEALGPGEYGTTNNVYYSKVDIDEMQGFGRLDLEFDWEFSDWLALQARSGGWYERAERDVFAAFTTAGFGSRSNFSVRGTTFQEMGSGVYLERRLASPELNSNTSIGKREVWAWNGFAKFTFWDDFDAQGGVRLESLRIDSLNDPFQDGEPPDSDGTPRILPSRYVLFDRRDNPNRPEESGLGAGYNDVILGIEVPIDPLTGIVDIVGREALESLVNGAIDRFDVLPAAGLAWRPLEGLVLRGAYSQTVARPSFREMGYYITIEPGKDQFTVGNPQLDVSPVESWDFRAEYLFGDFGDLLAFSFFNKNIERPIEAIIVRDYRQVNGDSPTASYRTFFNNPNDAQLWGIELEARKYFDFVPGDVFEYLSLGGNFSYIDAQVARSATEIERAQDWFKAAPDPSPLFTQLSRTRRLYNQPEWIANADLSFDQVDWGTKVTLAVFAISDVLTDAGSTDLSGGSRSVTLDRYEDAFYQLDLIMSQSFDVPSDLGKITLKASIKNLTNSLRGKLYDPGQTSDPVYERRYRKGRDYSFSIGWAISF